MGLWCNIFHKRSQYDDNKFNQQEINKRITTSKNFLLQTKWGKGTFNLSIIQHCTEYTILKIIRKPINKSHKCWFVGPSSITRIHMHKLGAIQ